MLEAVALFAHARDMSTLLSGMQVDAAGFKADVARLVKPLPWDKNVAGE